MNAELEWQPCYIWPNEEIPFRLYYDSGICRIFLIDNIQHNFKWLKSYRQGLRKSDYFFVTISTNYHENLIIEARRTLKELNIDHRRFKILYNDSKEKNNFEKHGFSGEIVNINSFIEIADQIIHNESGRLYDAVMAPKSFGAFDGNATSLLGSLLLLNGNHGAEIEVIHDEGQREVFLIKDFSQKSLDAISRAKCGLLLENPTWPEPSIFAYLHAGLPIIATDTGGARSAWLDENNSVIVDANLKDLRKAVRHFTQEIRPNRALIQQSHKLKISTHRNNFIKLFERTICEAGSEIGDPKAFFEEESFPVMRTVQRPKYSQLFGTSIDRNIDDVLQEVDSNLLYLGASVTVQKEGYRKTFHKMLEDSIGRQVGYSVNAIGGTGSMFGLASFNKHINEYRNTKLCILEMSTGDLNLWITPERKIADVISRLVEAVTEIIPNTVIVHCHRNDKTPDQTRFIRELYNSAAARHGAPVIDLYRKMEELMESGELKRSELYRDHCHTTELGGNVTGRMLFEAISNLKFKRYANISKFNLKPKMNLVDVEDFFSSKDIGQLHYSDESKFRYIEVHENQALEIEYEGEVEGLLLIMGPSSGSLIIEHSADNIEKLKAFDQMCYYERPSLQPLGASAMFSGKRKIKLIATSEKMDATILKVSSNLVDQPRIIKISGFVGTGLTILAMKISSRP